jgi:hypothetical protein
MANSHDSPEALFTLRLFGYEEEEEQGIAELVHQTIMKCDMEIQHRLYDQIMLSGGLYFDFMF